MAPTLPTQAADPARLARRAQLAADGVLVLDDQGRIPSWAAPRTEPAVRAEDVGVTVAPLDENRKVPVEHLPDLHAGPDLSAAVDDLRARVAAMEDRLAALSPAPADPALADLTSEETP